MFKRYLFLTARDFITYALLLMSVFHVASPQQATISVYGYVRSAESGELLPGSIIRVNELSKGTVANKDGLYRIILPCGTYNIYISCIGYYTDTIKIISDTVHEIRRDIFLMPSSIIVPEIVVYADRQNPANEIMKYVIEHKKEILGKLRSYKFKAYTKTLLKMDEKGEGDTAIVGILETQTRSYWKYPDHYKEEIVARRQSANFTPEQNIFTVGRIPNLNEDVVTLSSFSIRTPTNQNAFRYYEFEMVDTLSMDDCNVFRIRLKPKSKTIPLFDGFISISDKSYLVMSVDIKCNEAVDLSPIKDVRIYQQFSLFESKYWLSIESVTTFYVDLAIPSVPPIFCEQHALLYDYSINTAIDEEVFDRQIIQILPLADSKDSSY